MRTKAFATVVIPLGIVALVGFAACTKKVEPLAETETQKLEPQHAKIEPPVEEPAAEEPKAEEEKEAAVEATPVVPAPAPKRRAKVRPVTGPVSQAPVTAPAGTEVAPATPAATVAATVHTAPPSNEGLLLNALIGHVGGGKSPRSFSEGVVELGYHFGETSIGVGQAAKKLYNIAPTGEEEFVAADTLIFVNAPLAKDFIGMKWQLEAGTTLPVSVRSSDVGHITRPSLGVRATKTLFNERVSISLAPSATYSFNRNVSGPNRVPLERASLGGLAEANVAIVKQHLSLVAWVKGRVHFFEQFDNNNTTPRPDTSTQAGSFIDWHITRSIYTNIGWTYGTSLIRDARYDSYFYDPIAHRFYAALGFSL